MNRRSFSLIEVMLASALFAILMVTATGIMMSSLRSSRKAAAIDLAKTEGAYALKAMEEQIGYADHVSCAGDTMSVYKLFTNEQITYRLSSSKIASNSSFLTSGDVVVSKGSPQLCANVFTCDPLNRYVNICFVIDKANGQDVTDKAGINGILFQSMVTLINATQ